MKPPRRTRFLLVRHGATAHNAERRLGGSLDLALTEEGRAQVLRLRALVDSYDIDLAVVSPLKRSYLSAKILLEGRAVPVVIEPELRERDFGEWEGKTFAEVMDALPNKGADLMHGPFLAHFLSGESNEDFNARVKRLWRDHLLPRTQGRTALVVGHAAVMMSLLAVALGLDIEKALCDVPARQRVAHRARLVRWRSAPALRQSDGTGQSVRPYSRCQKGPRAWRSGENCVNFQAPRKHARNRRKGRWIRASF
ncbi:MAG: histidine phosphatase family protein [Deltaproteobacteria bacterium]|nr:histidine phosphatase family protein [Deltaproteobacteria bacterium]